MTHVVCPACQAVNRVPEARMDAWAQARCSRCGEALLPARPLDVSGEALRKVVARSDLPVVVDFWAGWCGPCRMMAPAFAEAAGRLAPGVRFLKLDTEAEQATSAAFGIRSIPTMVAFRGGREVARQSGALGADQIAQWVRGVTAP